MIYLTIGVLVLVVSLLSWLVAEQGKTIRYSADLAHRERVDGRARYLEAIAHSHDEYRALVESTMRQEGKVFVTPVSRFDDKIPTKSPDPPKHAFKFKPPPPVVGKES